MGGIPRLTPAAPARNNSMRAPQIRSSRAQSTAPSRPGVVSPSESLFSVTTVASQNGVKRKERDYEQEGEEETNINVVVRCRGRNEREVRENSGVVVSTDGVRGTTVKLAMGLSSINKTYHFDRVFSPAADQAMIYDDVVTPLLDEMLAGYNCTIFAYGQTGTGKTYTMSGDMTDILGILSDAAGIIPRALYALFNKLDLADAESSVKCSFIELYNEELRDLISAEENTKLKIYDDNSKRGHVGTIVQGMEESHIKSAAEGIKLLQEGSHRRQVAATKCNDLSSRSHTVFTVTVYINRTSENGEDYISAGKLNLVDLAGSENIQRSGAENKRAAEAGLINKSLLTLGRVINALVDRSSHIPYRESKLTRLLQDSLGGRTKTCIIATVSPAKSNLEETISTLDYAFRAKNIQNKPQVNQMINKKKFLKEFTAEIEKLKSELIATRQRNGVYLTNENYDEIVTESDSRRILNEEQAAKIETMETNLRNKVQELFSLTVNFMNLKKDHEGTKTTLDETKSLLEQTEFVLANTRQSLADEALLRKAHEQTEKQLSAVGNELISTLDKTVSDVGGLHSKLRRRSDLQLLNRNTWGLSQAQVSEVTSLVEDRVDEFCQQQGEQVDVISTRMQSFVREELEKLSSTQTFLEENIAAFDASEKEVSHQTSHAKEEMDRELEEIKTLRKDIKDRVGESLQGLSSAAERISAEVITELSEFHTQLYQSYSSLGRDFKSMFEDLVKHIGDQKAQVDELRGQLMIASEVAIKAYETGTARLDSVLAEERLQASLDRQALLSQITSLVMAQGESQDARLSKKIEEVQKNVLQSTEAFEASRSKYDEGMNAWNDSEAKLIDGVLKSREILKSRMKEDWLAANKHNDSLQTVTKSVHEETIRIVDGQIKEIGTQMQALDDFVSTARSKNNQYHESHVQSLQGLSATVRNSYSNIGNHFTATYERVRGLGDEMSAKTDTIREALNPLDAALRQPLAKLRSHIGTTLLQEYTPTGETPQKGQYNYPTELPRTQAHETLLAALRRPGSAGNSAMSPSKTIPVLSDTLAPIAGDDDTVQSLSIALVPGTAAGLREIDANIIGAGPLSSNADAAAASSSLLASLNSKPPSLLKRSTAGSGIKPPQRLTKKAPVVALEGRENAMLNSASSQSIGRRRSPRLG